MVLPVNERGEAVAAIRFDALPDVEHRPTGGVDQNAADVPECLEGRDRHAEGGEDDDVFSANSTEVEFSCLGPLEDLDAHPAQLRVHVRVVDDVTDEQPAPLGELLTGRICLLD